MAACCGDPCGSIWGAFGCSSLSKAARNGFVEDGPAGALSGAGFAAGEGSGEPVRALRKGLLELRVGDSAEESGAVSDGSTRGDQTEAR
jgi:hypothetical protein